MPISKLENARQVCQKLNIAPQTLYAYVSRGLMRTTQHPDDSRKKLYFSEDVEKLLDRQNRGRSRQEIARSTVDFGEPVLKSRISSIRDGAFFYRGVDAVTLSRTASLESIFELLCETSIKPDKTSLRDLYISKRDQPLSRFVDALANDMAARGSYGNKRTAYRLLKLMACNAIACDASGYDRPIHEQLANAWSSDPSASDLIRRALVLSADHELNASTYATRVTASAGASIAACLLTGISTLSGRHHGGLTDLCLQWMHKLSQESPKVITLSQNKYPPGFGHRLYPNGDPRAKELLEHCSAPNSWQTLATRIRELNSLALPTLDFALATIEFQLKLPKSAGFSIFAIGRMVGWLAHCFEQRKNGSLIRPRAF